MVPADSTAGLPWNACRKFILVSCTCLSGSCRRKGDGVCTKDVTRTCLPGGISEAGYGTAL